MEERRDYGRGVAESSLPDAVEGGSSQKLPPFQSKALAERTLMAVIRSFRDLDAWRVAMDLVVLVYSQAGRLPSTERFELSAQMRRAAVSVPSNAVGGQTTALSGGTPLTSGLPWDLLASW